MTPVPGVNEEHGAHARAMATRIAQRWTIARSIRAMGTGDDLNRVGSHSRVKWCERNGQMVVS